MKFQILSFALLFIHSTLGEVEFICPQPLDPSSIVTSYTELTPGPHTIVFRESRPIQGAPFKLSIVRSGIECVLLDHIPSQRDDTYYVTVNIPSIRCSGASDQCRMVLWQIDTTSSGGYCTLDKCTTYNSSAAVSIRTGANDCPDRRSNYNLYNWPYDPVRRYTSSLVGSSSTARAMGTFLLIGSTILYNVNVTVPFSSSQPDRVEFLYNPDDSTPISSVNIPSGQTGVMGSWVGVSTFAAYVFRNESMYVRISANDGTIIMGVISSAGMNMIDNIYGMEYGMYTSTGWLDGDMFVGLGANASLFTQPHGTCSQAVTRYFGCMLSGNDRSGGTVAMSITGTRLWFSMDMFNLSSDISSVRVEGVAIEALDLTPFRSDGYRLRGLIDVSNRVQERITSGLSTVTISISGNNGKLSCSLEEGIIGVLDSFYEVPPVTVSTNGSATAFLYFSVDGALNYQITLNSLTSSLTAAHIHGPAYQGISSDVQFDISNYITGNMEGGWNVQGTQRNLTADQLRYFIEGLYYLNMHTVSNPSGELRGQISIVGDWVCPSSGSLVNQCYWPKLVMIEGAQVNSDRTPSAVGGVVLDRYQRLQYSFSFWYIPENEVLTLHLMSAQGSLDTVIIDDDDASNMRSNVREISIVYLQQFDQTIPQLELQQFENGEVWFNVTSTSNPSGLLSGKLPRLTRNQCTGMTKYNETVGGENGWVPTGSVYPSMRLLQGDMLQFTYSSPETVYQMENANRLAGCVFTPSTATLLSETESISPVSYYHPLTDTGYLYFASRESCQNQQMRLTVFVVAAEPNSDSFTSSDCSKSLYKRLTTNSSGFAGAITATIVGLVFGIVIVAVAIVIGVYVIIKGQKISGDSGDVAKS